MQANYLTFWIWLILAFRRNIKSCGATSHTCRPYPLLVAHIINMNNAQLDTCRIFPSFKSPFGSLVVREYYESTEYQPIINPKVAQY